MGSVITYPPRLSTVKLSVSRLGYKPMDGKTQVTVTSEQSRSGFLLPERFDHLKASGFMPATQYTASRINRNVSLGTSSLKWGYPTAFNMTHTDTFFCTGNNVYSINDARGATARTIAIAAANANLRNQSMSLIETTFEGRKTLKMAVDALKTIKKAAFQIKKKNFKGAAETLGIGIPTKVSPRRTADSNWLEYRYGWTPLLYEVYGALEHLRKDFQTDKILRVKGSGSIGVSATTSSTISSGNTGNFDQGHITYKVTTKTKGTFKATVGYVYKITNVNAVQSQSLGLSNPLLTAWELMTLSFVADWFANVSDVLAQLDAWSGKEFLGGFSTLKYDESTTRKSTLVSVGSGYTSSGFSPAVGTVTTEQVNRIPLTQQPSIGLVIRPQLNLKRLIDGVALLRQMSR